jgi:pimeloyl-ACP methyl ester carboxylesterase
MKFLDIDGLKIHYKKEGSGYPIILLHGHGGNLHLFDDISKRLKKDYLVVSYDQRGYGLSDKTFQTKYSTELWAEDLYQIFEKLDIKNAVIGGHSMSGRICTTFTKIHPELVKGLIIFNTTWYGSNPRAAESLENAAEIIVKEGMNHAIKTSKSLNSIPVSRKSIFHQVTNMLLKNEPNSYSNGSKAVAMDFKGDSRNDLLETINIPTLIMIGDRDSAPLEGALFMYRKIEDSRLTVIPNSGHYSILEKPEFVYFVLKEFLDGITGKMK